MLGLAIGLACCILIGLYIIDETGYDRHHTYADRIFRIVQVGDYDGVVENSSSAPFPLGPALEAEYPELITSVVRFFNNQAPRTLIDINENRFYESGLFYVDSTIFNVFDINFIIGNPKHTLIKPDEALITESIAKKYFNAENPIGKLLKLEYYTHVKVVGVIKDPPPQSHIQYKILVSMETLRKLYKGSLPNSWVWNPCWTYVLLKEGISKKNLEDRFPEFIQNYFYDAAKDKQTLYLQSIKDIHLNRGIRTKSLDFEISPQGNESYIYILSYIGIFLLIIAGINFMNLATASSSGRVKEIGMKKVMGVTRTQLIIQFICETIIMSFIAMIVAVSLVELSLPLYNDFTGKTLSLNSQLNFETILGLSSLVIFIGIFSGLYPAFYLSAFQPINVLRGNFYNNMKNGLARKIMVVIQFVIAVTLITSTLIAMNQIHFMKNADTGFTRDHIIILSVKNSKIAYDFKSFKSELLEVPFITHVTGMDYIIGSDHNNHDFRPEGFPANSWQFYPALNIRDDFLETFDIKLVAGRDFYKNNDMDKTHAILINEAMVKHMGWKSNEAAIGKNFYSRYGVEKVVGVFKNFNVKSFHVPASPFVLDIKETDGLLIWATNYVAVRITPGSTNKAIQKIKTIWKKFLPNRPFEYKLLNDELIALYKKEDDLRDLAVFFTVIVIFIATIGLFGLVSYLTEKRTKEIGIKKVMGASTFDVVKDLSIDFLKLALIAIIIAIPFTFFITSRWLQNFAYHVKINPWLFIIASGVMLLITLIITITKSYYTSQTDPVDTLKYE
ncbi:FtsX-like permease family protein [Bacteroidota bacterium]